MQRGARKPFDIAKLGLLGLCLSVVVLLLAPVASRAASSGSGPTGGGAGTAGQCMIEPWYCGPEEPAPPEECMIEPWECEGEAPETCEGEMRGYIIVFYDWVEDPGALAHEQVEKYGGQLGFIYRYALKGYSAHYPPDVIDDVGTEPSVDYIEEDGMVEIAGAGSSGTSQPAAEGDCLEEPAPPEECMIEPWECGPEEPAPPEECMIEPWECERTGTGTAAEAAQAPAAGGPGAESDGGAVATIAAKPRACPRGKVRRHGRCLHRRARAREQCAGKARGCLRQRVSG